MSQIDDWITQAAELSEADKIDEAVEVAGRVLMLEPDNHKALFVLGSAMLKGSRNVQAQQFLRRVCQLKPNAAQGWGQLAISSAEMHRYEESIRFAEKAHKLRPTSRTWADMSFTHTTAGNWARGRECAVASLKLEPECKDAIVHLANCDLAEQRWVEGWAGFKATEGSKWRKLYQYGDTQEWQGEPDAVVMVTGEQGVGDEVMMSSVIPDAIRGCRQFIFDCDERIHGLFQRSFPGAIVTPTRHAKTVELPMAPTHHKTLFGLAELFRTSDESFPRKPFLVPNPDYVRMFKSLLGGKRTIGLAWSGGFPRTGQVERTAGLSAFHPLLRAEPDVQFLSLQYKDDAAEVKAFEERTGARIMRLPWVTQGRDIDVLAGLIAALDEVVGVHTAALHLSSGMGVPTTTLTHRGSGWRYAPKELLWYPASTRLWPKDRGESWRDTVAALARFRAESNKVAA